MANTLTIDDISTVVNAVLTNAQGGSATANTGDFTTVAQLAQLQGYDPLNTAISQVLSKTIFSYRPYGAKFQGLYKDDIRWGNKVRKLNPIDKPVEVDNRLREDNGTLLADGASIDPWKINKPEVLETAFYGSQQFQKSMTVWKDQMDTAFSSPEQFGNFLTMVMGNATDQLEQARENLARGTVVNMIGAASQNSAQVVHLITEYNAASGATLDAQSVLLPANFRPFMQWVYARLRTIIDRMTERSHLYHLNPYKGGSQKLINRHTPIANQKCYMLADFMNKSETMAIAEIFHDDYLKFMDYEKVNFWQSLATPGSISTTISYLDAGSAQADSAVSSIAFASDAVVGVIFDEDAAGINLVNQWAGATALNPRGLYSNYFWHFTGRHYVDQTENVVVLCLD